MFDCLPPARQWFGAPHRNYVKKHSKCDLREFTRELNPDQNENVMDIDVDENEHEIPMAVGNEEQQPIEENQQEKDRYSFANRDIDAGRCNVRNAFYAMVGMPVHPAFRNRPHQ